MQKFIFLFLISPVFFNGHALGYEEAAYKIIFNNEAPARVHVSATLPVTNGNLLMYPNGALSEDGWAEFVKNLQVMDSKGQEIKLTRNTGAKWSLPEGITGQVNMEYDVMLTHNQSGPWPAGRNEAAYTFENGAVFTGRSLFISDPEEQAISVEFFLPGDWQVLTSWERESATPNVFNVSRKDELFNSVIVMGNFKEIKITEGPLNVSVAVLGDMARASGFLESTLEVIIEEFSNKFGQPPKASVLAVIGKNNDDEFWRGGVFNNGISMLFPAIPNQDNLSQWMPTLAHEIFHLWNGTSIVTESPEEWFKEGFTVYYSSLALIRLGLLEEKEVYKMWARLFHMYLHQAKSHKVSLRQAGENKGQNYFVIYGGGLAAAISLDILIREKTDNSFSLEDVMKKAGQIYGNKTKILNANNLENLILKVTKVNVSGFFDRYISGGELIPIENNLGRIGLKFRNGSHGATIESFLEIDPGFQKLREEIFVRK